MTRPVNSRSYDNEQRRAASQRTRARILGAARNLLVEHGYRATTVARIARAAEVSVDTVYELVGRKPLIVGLLIETAISGTDNAVPAQERDYVQRIHEQPTAAAKLHTYARAMVSIQARMAPLVVALRDAASADPSAMEIWNEFSNRRATNMRLLAAELRQAGGVRADLDDDDVADIIWATNSPELYLLLTRERGWNPERYGRWLADAWQRQLLDHPL
jgi:AcrR family transcriptional regulator